MVTDKTYIVKYILYLFFVLLLGTPASFVYAQDADEGGEMFWGEDEEEEDSEYEEDEEYIEEDDITKIRAHIIVERDSQKGILIGKGGDMLRRIGTEARKEIQNFIDKHVYLETFVKVDKDWRGSSQKLKKYGY